jgi:protoporphyrinogen oxidase
VTADLLVLGAGPAGAGAAYRAARSGHDVVLIERAAVAGGAAGSFELAGVRVDYGSHRLHPTIDAGILEELRALLGEELERRSRHGRILLEGRWIAFPPRPLDALTRLPPSFLLGAARDAATASARTPRDGTFAEVLRAGLGPTMCERFYFPYARKIWGVEPERLDGEQARRRVSAGSTGSLTRRLLSRGSGSWFWYPRRGYGTISERLAEAAGASGASLRFGTSVEALDVSDDRVVAVLSDGATVTARRAFTTLPLATLARLVHPTPPAAVHDAVASLRTRALVLVYLVLALDRCTPYDAHYFPGPFTPVTRISEPKNYRSGGDPAGRTVLCAEIPCDVGDAVWNLADEAAGELVGETLAEAGFRLPPPEAVALRRLPSAYPIYDLGWGDAFATVDEWAGSLPRLLTFGRQGLFAHDNAHHALAMAWAAADALRADGGFDRPAWEAARLRFAAHVVED